MVNRFMSSLVGANGPRASRSIRLSNRRVVFPFPMRVPDGVDRRQIQYVKTHFSNIGKSSLAVFECRVALHFMGAGTRKHFVPSAITGLLSIYDDHEFFVPGDGGLSGGVLGHQGRKFII